MSDYDRSIHSDPDAAAWADFFGETHPDSPHDRDTMLGWFANAMMAMHDHLYQTGRVVEGGKYARLRDAARALVARCRICGGRGTQVVDDPDRPKKVQDVPCPECGALREALGEEERRPTTNCGPPAKCNGCGTDIYTQNPTCLCGLCELQVQPVDTKQRTIGG